MNTYIHTYLEECIVVHIARGVGAGQADQTTALPIFTKTSIKYYFRMEICASLAILPNHCLICLTKVQLFLTPLITT